jgi:hypothetical protein
MRLVAAVEPVGLPTFIGLAKVCTKPTEILVHRSAIAQKRSGNRFCK